MNSYFFFSIKIYKRSIEDILLKHFKKEKKKVNRICLLLFLKINKLIYVLVHINITIKYNPKIRK